MNSLKHDWLTDHLIDFEYKQYILLAYLKKVRTSFDGMRLFPELSELIFHYRNLMSFIESRTLVDENLPVEMSGIDIEGLKIIYAQIADDDELMSVLNEIVAFAMPQMEDAIYEGREIYELVEEHIEMDPVGIIPLYNKEGYFFLTNEETPNVMVYRYDLSNIDRPDETFRTISSEFVKEEEGDFSMILENLKLALAKEKKDLPVPATYSFHSSLRVPLEETFLPIAKRMLLKELMAA